MPGGRIISVHSYRGGTGKSNLTANLATVLVDRGLRVAVLDTDVQSPGVHIIFGFEVTEARLTLVDFLWGRCGIEETSYDVTDRIAPESAGRCWLVPASMRTDAITRIVEDGYDVSRLNAHFDRLIEELELDVLLIDTHPGLNRETMLTTAISDVLLILIRPDQQDLQGTAVLTEVAGRLEVPSIGLVANKVLPGTDRDALAAKLQETFGSEVLGLIPLSEDLARLGSRGIFVHEHPHHEVTRIIEQIAARIVPA